MNYYADIAEGFDADKQLVDDLRGYQVLPFFFSRGEADLPPDRWGQYMFQCKPLGDTVYLATHTDSRDVVKWKFD